MLAFPLHYRTRLHPCSSEATVKRWLLLACALLIPAMVLGNDAKLAPELKNAASGQMISVIVQYKTVPGSIQKNEISANAGQVMADLTLINGLSVLVPPTALVALAADAQVAYISPDRAVRGSLNNA